MYSFIRFLLDKGNIHILGKIFMILSINQLNFCMVVQCMTSVHSLQPYAEHKSRYINLKAHMLNIFSLIKMQLRGLSLVYQLKNSAASFLSDRYDFCS